MLCTGWRNNINVIDEAATEEFSDLAGLHSLVIHGSLEFFRKEGMLFVNVPFTTGSASSPMGLGSDSAPVRALIHDKSILLTDSAQFYLEYAIRSYKRGCYYYGHSFRDEEPDSRHLAQFSHVECEIEGTLAEVKDLVFRYVKYLTEYIYANMDEKYKRSEAVIARVDALRKKEGFTSVSYTEACRYLAKFEGALKTVADKYTAITSLGEKLLIEKHGEFIWLENWDKMLVPFYQAVDEKTGLAKNADLLFGIGEVVGMGERHFSKKALRGALNEHRVDENDYTWYLDLKEKHPMQTSGFGMGVERYLMWLLGIEDIRDVELFTRDRDQNGKI